MIPLGAVKRWAAIVAAATVAGTATPGAGAPSAIGDGDLLVESPADLIALEARGFGIGRIGFATPDAADNAALASDSGYQDILAVLHDDFTELYHKDKAWGPDMRHSHRGFDLRWLTSRHARWELVAAANRADRKAFAPGTCGELRFIYRLAYTVATASGPFSSRLPATLNIVYRQPDDGAGCRDAPLALRSEKPALGRLQSVEINIQSSRWPSTIRPDMGGHADYLLRVFHRDGAHLRPFTLENTPDLPRLSRDTALKRELLAWVRAHAPAIDSGIALAPERFLAHRALSVTPHGLARPQNRPWTGLFSEKDVAGLSLPPKALLRRLDGLSCMGCHQSRSLAGFHIVGAERDAGRRADALGIGISPHLEADLPRRRAYLAALLSGAAPDDRRPPAEHARNHGGFGDVCGLAPAFSAWTCAPGFACRSVDNSDVGECMPADASPGAVCQSGLIDSRADRLRAAKPDGCGLMMVCDEPAVGFPGGMCASSCLAAGEHAVCGAIAQLEPFNACLARGELFTKCAQHATPAGLRQCGPGDPCRPDYICAKTAQGESACLPPYFVLQMRVDGHPRVPK